MTQPPPPPRPPVHEETEGLYRVDHAWMGQPGLIASYLFGGRGELAVVEAGPASTRQALLAGIRAAGRDPAEVTHLFLTHVHLDHAAGAGALLHHDFPRACAYVHPAGAPHLADPTRLLASAARLYGERMDELWGAMLPVPPDRLRVLQDEEEVRVGGVPVRALDTPGHARHHLAFHLPGQGAVFTGDVGGVRLQGSSYVRPPTPPPEFDPAAWLHSVSRLRGAAADLLLPTHFGGFPDAGRHLDELAARVEEWTAWARGRVSQGVGPPDLADELRARGDAEIAAAGGGDLAARYEAAVPYSMMASGLHRHVTRH